MRILIHWFVATLAIIITAYILPGVSVEDFFVAVVAAVVIGLINTFIRPAVLVLTLPINIVTLGLLTFVINALLVMLASAIVPGFYVANFWWALLFSIVLFGVNLLFKYSARRGFADDYSRHPRS
ncbi:MAG: hypothetical protein A3C84_00205 [Candidatus Ryanbacteria bacterium RIFCSPHIGHO2_02_FULL_48_12]|uniref:Phage holin family protein n=1 Tax=Candidatus Ryanbacteria bacterium RIFCSPHIGHO2_01_FULL_48_27 TaxID=1802115 RepID=A0A1G2G593_9BACT|nr:MAG: hypothetical protein A2756_00235 [Candidatus Ryanbacteria bacterium RIFCSPHIGHO2_01_FULL_48_27]OGZ50398.1 MAG: hypothetical protein A3C84_00205 [Candidatus Ryanbacteria bacterium RIFCSPHIGHO2_02_FULL_48_12]